MTDEERKNRNPKPETMVLKLDDCPELPVSALKLHQVYILHGPRMAASMNFAGKSMGIHPKTLDAVPVYKFFAPRLGLTFLFTLGQDGKLCDMDGARMLLRQYNGPDA